MGTWHHEAFALMSFVPFVSFGVFSAIP